jgi:DNA-binding HxlR family transcriptional regulator
MRKRTSPLKSITNPLSLRIIDALRRCGPVSYSALYRGVGEPTPALFGTMLKKLRRDRIVERHVLDLGPPPATEYNLAPLGQSLAPLASAMCTWLLENQNEIMKNRAECDPAIRVRRRRSRPHFDRISTVSDGALEINDGATK